MPLSNVKDAKVAKFEVGVYNKESGRLVFVCDGYTIEEAFDHAYQEMDYYNLSSDKYWPLPL